MKKIYIGAVRSARGIADKCGLLATLERSNGRNARWVRSLFSIYDSADLIHLDLPWWTFAAIDAVEAHLSKKGGKARVFEFGAGASTVWLAKRCHEVITVEHDVPFAQSMRPAFSAYKNIDIHIRPPSTAIDDKSTARSKRKGYTTQSFDDYVASIDRQEGPFDLIIIDGRARLACLAKARHRLKPDGIILFDNSDRAEYRSGIEASGLEEHILRGMTPTLPFPGQTSLLLQKG
jgi:hypothetical protein